MRSLEPQLPPTLPAPTRKHIDKATNIIYTHVNRHNDNEISEGIAQPRDLSSHKVHSRALNEILFATEHVWVQTKMKSSDTAAQF